MHCTRCLYRIRLFNAALRLRSSRFSRRSSALATVAASMVCGFEPVGRSKSAHTHTHSHTATQPHSHTPAVVRLGSDTFILMGAGAGARRRCWTRRNIRGAMRDAAAAAAAATTRASAETPPRSTACVTERWAPTMADSCTTASMSFISSAGDCWKDCVSMLNLGSHARTIECARGPRQQPLHVA